MSLRRRITAAYAFYAVGMVIFFALITTFTVEGIEGRLVDERLRQAALWAVPRHAAGLTVEMPAGISFHYDQEIPHALRDLPDGVHDKHIEGQGLHVLVGSDQGRPYVVVDHQSDYDKVELVVYAMVACCMLAFLLFSYFLANHLARGVINPLAALSSAVASGQPLPKISHPRELAELAHAFELRTDSLRQALERERYFAGDVSHELRTALTIILGAAEVLQAQAGAKNTESSPARRIHRAATDAGELVQVLLLLARAPTSEQASLVDIGTIAAREIERHAALAAAKNIVLRLGTAATFTVQAPAELCAAAIGNLIRNACIYTEAGEVAVHFAPRQLIVEDTGNGLPAAVLAAIEHNAAPPSSGSAGTGLGLSLTQRICHYLGASLAYEARPEGGSRFTITFASA
jgi:signal transduction histidine kinase